MSLNNPTPKPEQPEQPPLEQEQPPARSFKKVVHDKTPSRERQNHPSEQPEQLSPYGGYREIRGGISIPKPPNTGPCTRARACPVPERFTERALSTAVRAAAGLCWKFTSPGTDGVPDRIVILPGGRIGFVEVKTTGAKPRPLQVRRLAQLDDLGVPVFVVDHPDQIPEVLDAIRAA